MTLESVFDEKDGYTFIDDLESALDFIVPYDEGGLRPLGPINLLSLEFGGLSEEELRPLRVLAHEDEYHVGRDLRDVFSSLQVVRSLMSDETTRSSQSTWDLLDTNLSRYSSILLRFGRDRDHYGSDVASRAVHGTSYYKKAWKTQNWDESNWIDLSRSLEQLSTGVWHMYNGNVNAGDESNERAGITLERLLRGNDLVPLRRTYMSESDDSVRVHVVGNDDDGPSLVPDTFAETGSTSTLKELFPFFKYWSEKAERFVNSEKTVTIELNIGKFFEDINVTMASASDTGELERNFVQLLNRSLEIALGSADF